jgi:hypothetical protein
MPDIRIKDFPTTATAPASDDYLELDGATNGSRKLAASQIVGNDLIRRMVSRVISNGATTNRARILTLGAIGNVAGLPITIEVAADVETSLPTSSFSYGWITSTSSPGTTQAWSLQVTFLNSGELIVRQDGATPATDFRRFGYAGFKTAYSGKRVRIAVVLATDTTDPVVTVNGVNISSSFALTTGAGTTPAWMPAGLLSTYLLDGYNSLAGDSPTANVVIGAYSDAEAVTWTAGGQRPAWAERAGSAVAYYSQAFAAGVDSFAVTGPGAVRNTAGELEFYGTSGSGDNGVYRGGTLVIGVPYTIKAKFRVSAGMAATWAYVGLRTASNTMVQGQLLNGTTQVEIQWESFTSLSTFIGGGTRLSFAFGSSPTTITTSAIAPGESAFIDDIEVIQHGLIDNPIPQPGLTTFDSLGRMSRRNVGHVNVTDRDTVTIIANTFTSGASGELALGGAIVSSANDIVIDHIEQSTKSGTPTTSIGSAASGAQYKASGALSAGLNVFTPVTRKLASTNIYVVSSDGTNVRTIIHGHRASVPVS